MIKSCPICENERHVYSERALNRHMCQAHPQGRNFCNLCGWESITERGLIFHLINTHLIEIDQPKIRCITLDEYNNAMNNNKENKSMETFTASVVFADSPRKYDAKYARKYTFKCDIPLEIGDMVVVDCANGYQVVKVVATSEGVHEQATAWVLSKVNMDGHAKRSRIAELEKLIEKEVSKVSYRTQAEMLSGITLNFKPNEKLRKLMFELNELTGN